MATRARSRSALGAVSASRVVNGALEELIDYNALRGERGATMIVAHVTRPTLVLGGNQSPNVVDPLKLGATALRRRRGGGGLVLLRPNDVWIDWWIPATDPRWSRDVHVSSVRAGEWWASELRHHTKETVSVHVGPLEGDTVFRVVCFAGRGPGEVFVGDRKTVGVTQWRVREGVLLSTVLPAQPTSDVIEFLASVPPGLSEALDHQGLDLLRLSDPKALLDQLRLSSGPWHYRALRSAS
jgi:lipoate-protein ligase A